MSEPTESAWKKEFDEAFGFLESPDNPSWINTGLIKKFIASLIERAKEEAESALVERQEAGSVPYYTMRMEQARQEGRDEAVDYIEKNSHKDNSVVGRDTFTTVMGTVLEAARTKRDGKGRD